MYRTRVDSPAPNIPAEGSRNLWIGAAICSLDPTSSYVEVGALGAFGRVEARVFVFGRLEAPPRQAGTHS
jgi:hypothetical protein